MQGFNRLYRVYHVFLKLSAMGMPQRSSVTGKPQAATTRPWRRRRRRTMAGLQIQAVRGLVCGWRLELDQVCIWRLFASLAGS